MSPEASVFLLIFGLVFGFALGYGLRAIISSRRHARAMHHKADLVAGLGPQFVPAEYNEDTASQDNQVSSGETSKRNSTARANG